MDKKNKNPVAGPIDLVTKSISKPIGKDIDSFAWCYYEPHGITFVNTTYADGTYVAATVHELSWASILKYVSQLQK